MRTTNSHPPRNRITAASQLRDKVKKIATKLERFLARRSSNVLHIGSRSIMRRRGAGKGATIIKRFDDTEDGRNAFANELLARDLFSANSWMAPTEASGSRQLKSKQYPEEKRLDRQIASMDYSTRIDIAQQATCIAWDIFRRGYAHRDLHARNLFLIHGQLVLIDFETLLEYPSEARCAFSESYDVTGRGLDSPFRTNNMGYASDQADALQTLLGVPKAVALHGVEERLRDELREACLTFKTAERRHVCRAGKIYSSFTLPYFSVARHKAQRDSTRRLEKLGVSLATIQGRRVLDLGSNVGAMLFEIQKLEPAWSWGVEYDAAKVAIAQKLARYTGMTKLAFERADIDTLNPEKLGTFDVVFCFSINEHVKDPARLFWLLGQVTTQRLYFEGNSGTDISAVAKELTRHGFRRCEYLGLCDDDCVSSNNVRPILSASRAE